MSITALEQLDAWCKARDFALKVYRKVLPLLPAEEKWGLNQQIRRAANSIPANIAEGHGRFYYQDNVRFCYIARSSLEETLSHIVMTHELKYIPTELYQEIAGDGEALTRLINGYIAYLKKRKQGANEPGANYMVREAEAVYEITDSSLLDQA
jgi:four helix bundle protein